MKIKQNIRFLTILLCLLYSSAILTKKGNDMSITSWKPFNDLEELFEFRPFRGKIIDVGNMNMYQEDGNIIVKMNVPGFEEDDLKVCIHNKHLHISGNREEKKEEKDKDYYHKEMSSGSFKRVIELPDFVDEDAVEAEMHNGILTVILPKSMKEEKEVKKIKIVRK